MSADNLGFVRLQREFSEMMEAETPGITASPKDESMFSWIGKIEGSKGTPYEGLSYRLSLYFLLDYPFKPPIVKFETPCFHPNVDAHGNICLDILQDKWSPVQKILTTLLSIQSLLGDPCLESPLNCEAARLWAEDQDAYKEEVQKHYQE